MYLQSVDSRAHVHKHVAINVHFASLHGLAINIQIEKTAFDIVPIRTSLRSKEKFSTFLWFNVQLDKLERICKRNAYLVT